MTALFDFDGVLMDTETQYSRFWDDAGKRYVDMEGFGQVIKGQTLKQIFSNYFSRYSEEELSRIEAELNDFESNMDYGFIPGAREFLEELKNSGIRTAIVTSSNDKKMSNVYSAHPDLADMVDTILTSEDFSRSKPDPECFVKGMERLGGRPESAVVFEDSIHGLKAGRASGAIVVGLATTNQKEVIEPLCDMVIDDFSDFSLSLLLQAFPSLRPE